jgi:alanyl-tRNA synthetase
MNQFKDVFLGKTKREYSRATTSQKCIRAGGKHNDLENVGHTTRHCTFFEMLGNFSFGDYFKKDAIRFAWEVATTVFCFPEDKIWPTVFRDDDEAFDLWSAHVPSKRICRFGEKENFWAMGDTGPCGPCSELLFDRGPSYGNASSPLEDTAGERYLEFWNLVFMQYNKEVGGKTNLLPKPSIDTGAGLERVVSLIQGKETIFETDVLRGLIAAVEEASGKTYDKDSPLAPAFRVIADHIRCLAFAIADGAQPSNTDRGYVLRKVLRRAVRYGRQLGFEAPFLARILPALVQLMGDPYQELRHTEMRAAEILTLEEEAFFRTLRRGGNMMSRVIDQSKKAAGKISGDDAFLLKDTYGLPFEEIELLAKDYDLSVDTERFSVLEEESRQRSKAARKTTSQVAEQSVFANLLHSIKPCQFIRIPLPDMSAQITAMIKDGNVVDKLESDCDAMIILDQTPFYAEMGGEVGDKGVIRCGNAEFVVTDTQSPFPGIIAHIGTLKSGTLRINDSVTAAIDRTRREKIESNHTATHLLHLALHEVLGPHAHQRGSLVDEERLRFDFVHHKALTNDEINAIESRVNELIRQNHAVVDYEIPLEEAQKCTDIKQFFGEKYGNVVRVLQTGPSKELCGGCHVLQTGRIGYFRIVKELSIAAGVRRIEAVSGQCAVVEARRADGLLEEIATLVKVPTTKLLERITTILAEKKAIEIDLQQCKKEKIASFVAALSMTDRTPNRKIIHGVLSVPIDELKIAAEESMKKHSQAVLVIGCIDEGKAHLLIRVPSQEIERGTHAGELLKKGLSLVEGNGGGRAESAQGAGKRIDKLDEAIEHIVHNIT